MSFFKTIIYNFPEVKPPTQRKLSLKTKLKWTLIILVLFFLLSMIPLFGLGNNALQQFEYLSIILGAEFGSIMSLGIGPLVTSSIVLQLLNGSGIVKFNLNTSEGKKTYEGVQKLLSVFFIIFEATIYVLMGGLASGSYYDGATNTFLTSPVAGAIALSAGAILLVKLFLIFQLFLGGMIVMYMDEVTSKWGIGSGISLFIAAGVSKTIILRLISWVPSPTNPDIYTGAIPALFQALAQGQPKIALLMIAAILATALVFAISVYVQSMKVEIPLSFGKVRGYGVRWPLNFLYTSNIPVILVAAFLANIQVWVTIFGGQELSRTVGPWINGPVIVQAMIEQGGFGIGWITYLQALCYMLLLIGGSVLFSVFWIQTSGQDARSQAKKILSSGLQIPGFRKDERILETILNRYVMPLTVMGAITVGFIAALADLSGALGRGTGILLTVMILYQLYENIAREHMYDMNPAMKKFMGK